MNPGGMFTPRTRKKSLLENWKQSKLRSPIPRLPVASYDDPFDDTFQNAPEMDTGGVQSKRSSTLPNTLPSTPKAERRGGQASAPTPRPPRLGTPLRPEFQPPRPAIPLMDRIIIDPGRHNPPPYAGVSGIPRKDLQISIRAIPHAPNPNDPPPHDYFFDNEKIVKLNYNNFTTFLSRTDAALVMFYVDNKVSSQLLAKTFSEAAKDTKRANHAFAGVDCGQSPYLCDSNGVYKFPSVRIYSRDYCLGEVKHLALLTAEEARQLVEQAPNVDKSILIT